MKINTIFFLRNSDLKKNVYVWKGDAVKQSYENILVVRISIKKFSSVPNLRFMAGKVISSITSFFWKNLYYITYTALLSACLVNVMVVAYIEIFPILSSL